ARPAPNHPAGSWHALCRVRRLDLVQPRPEPGQGRLGQHIITHDALALSRPGEAKIVANRPNRHKNLLLVAHLDQSAGDLVAIEIDRPHRTGHKSGLFVGHPAALLSRFVWLYG